MGRTLSCAGGSEWNPTGPTGSGQWEEDRVKIQKWILLPLCPLPSCDHRQVTSQTPICFSLQ